MEPATVNMNTVISLSAFRTVNAGLSSDDKELAIRQAFTLFDELYAHLPLKKAMHAVDPVQRLMVMTQRLQQMSDESEFHRQMMTTFISVQDLHTNYLLPDPYRTAVAFQPFMIDEYYDEAGIPHCSNCWMMPAPIDRLLSGIKFDRVAVPSGRNGSSMQMITLGAIYRRSICKGC